MAELEQGAIFAGHRIEGIAGRGGFGVVYRATHLHLDHVVALKLISSGRGGEETFRQRFISESRIAVSIRHPNVVAVHNAGEEDGLLYVTMDFIDGTDLRGLLNREGRLTPESSITIVRQLAAALDAAHEKGLVHRDIKPGNVLIDERGGGQHVYLTDFGLSKQMDATSGVTASGAFVGTLDYVAPEQIKGARLDARTDVYALGCVMFELLSGDVPFSATEEKVAKIYAHLQEEPPELIDAAPEVPPALSEVVWRAMAKEPDDRHPSAGDFARAAAAAVEGRQPSEPERNVGIGAAAPTQVFDKGTVAAAAAGAGAAAAAGGPEAAEAAAPETVETPPPKAGQETEAVPPPGGDATVAVPPPAQRVPPAEADVVPEASTPGETVAVPPPGTPGPDEVAPHPHSPAGRKRSGRTMLLGGIALLALAGGAYALLGASDKAADDSQGQANGGGGGGGDGGAAATPGLTQVAEVATKPVGIAVDGERGNVWVSSRGGEALTLLTDKPEQQEGEKLKLGGEGEQVNIDPDGFAWVAVGLGAGAAGQVERFDPDGKSAGDPIPVGIDPRGVAGGDRNQWVVNNGSDDVTRVDRETLEPVPFSIGTGPARAAEGGDTAIGIWVTNAGANTVGRITAFGDSISEVSGLGGEPRGIVAEGSDIWAAGQDNDTLYRIESAGVEDAKATGTAGTVIQETNLSKVCDEPRSLAAGFDTIWITCGKSQGVARVDAESGEVVGEAIEGVGPDPEGVATDANGVWVTSGGEGANDPGTVTFIDPDEL